MFQFFRRPRPIVFEVIPPSRDAIDQKRRAAALARSIADVMEERGLPCDGPTALRMFATHLNIQAQV
jgi:hypothetical protein